MTVISLSSLRYRPRIGLVEVTGIEPVSKPETILMMTYTIGGLRRRRARKGRIRFHHLLLISRKQEFGLPDIL